MRRIEHGYDPQATFLKCLRFSVMSFFYKWPPHPTPTPHMASGTKHQGHEGVQWQGQLWAPAIVPEGRIWNQDWASSAFRAPPRPPLRPTTQPQSVLTQSVVKRPRARAHRCMKNPQPLSSTVLVEENGSNLVEHALPVCYSLRMMRRIDLYSL